MGPGRGSRFPAWRQYKNIFCANVMFARVFDTAKRILSRSPSYQGESEEASQGIPRSADGAAEDETMVTTRRGTGTTGSVQSTPASSTRSVRGKRHLELEIQETSTPTKRRRKAVAKEEPATEEVGDGAQDSIEASADADADSSIKSIPVRTRSQQSVDLTLASTPVARRGSPKILISEPASVRSADGGDVFYTPAQHSFATTADEEDREGSITPRPTSKATKSTPASGKGSGKRGRPRKHGKADTPEKSHIASTLAEEIPSSTWESEQAPLSPIKLDNTAKSTDESGVSETQQEADADDVRPAGTEEMPSKDQVQDLASLGIAYEDVAPDTTVVLPRKHKRFGSEEPATMILQDEPTEASAAAEIEDNGSDSDEAPEMVTTSVAASKVKATAEEAMRARQAQQAKEDKRRQERADRMAQEQAEKREREEKKARKLAKSQAKLARQQQREGSSPARAPMDIDMHNLPDLLPDSILEAAGDRRPPTPPPARGGKTEEELRKEKLNRHIKFLDHGEKPIKDVKKGKVNVSVLAQRNALLAPKVNRDTKNIREHWLKGREANRKGRGGRKATTFKKMERRSVPGGFLRGGDDG
jgi:U3 small nucleolar RNA-associated protein 16